MKPMEHIFMSRPGRHPASPRASTASKWLTIFLFAALSLRADEVVLTNGRTIEGLVVSEDQDRVKLRTPEGTITYARSNIREVRKSALKPEVKTAEPSSGEPPRGMEGMLPAAEKLLERWKRLSAARETMLANAKLLPDLKAKRDSLGFQTHSMVNAHAELTRRNEVDAAKRLENKHAGILAQFNRLNSQISSIVAQDRIFESSWGSFAQDLKEYSEEYLAKRSRVQAVSGKDHGLAYFARIDAVMRQLGVTQVKSNLKYKKVGDHLVFDAYLNGRGPFPFMLDTGASSVVMSKDVARRVGVNFTGEKFNATLADGSTIVCEEAVIAHVRVAGQEASSVLAGVVDMKGDGKMEEGLLGMSFLRNFTILYNAATGEFEMISVNVPDRPEAMPPSKAEDKATPAKPSVPKAAPAPAK